MDRSAIHDMTLKARELLTGEIKDMLQSIYGLDSKGKFEDTKRLPAVQSLPEVRATRTRLEKFLNDEEQAGLKRPEAVDKLVKEVAFTHLNRLVAFKMMEARKLIRGTLDRYQESNAFKFYLAEYEDSLRLYEQGSLPQNEVGEGPRDQAYRHFLLWQCAELSKEIKVLFDSENMASRLFPRPRALKSLMDLMNDSRLEGAWGLEETIGWVYQSFNSEELEAAFREVRVSGKKFEAEDIPAVTQLFTPNWIVKFLVQNTLGCQWMQMHPDSRLAEKLDYLVPLIGEIPAEKTKPVREIKVLDPACGTMHFGLVAFDLLLEMYREEIENAGEPGWPKKPSVTSADAIPATIIANNIYGIDVDMRAVQLSTLALYLKAKTLNPNVSISSSNLACTNIQIINGMYLEKFLKTTSFTHPVYEKIIRSLWDHIKDARQMGSLLRLEKEIRDLVAREREAYHTTFARFQDKEHLSPEGGIDFWEILESQIIQAFDEFARQEAKYGNDSSFFADESVEGFKILDLMMRHYDVVVTNPPYMSHRKMNQHLKTLVSDEYPDAKGDLYAAFIQRCIELADINGRVGMLTMHSFMFICSYEDLRKYVMDRCSIETMAHLGPGLFDVGNPGTLQTVAYILRYEPDAARHATAQGTFFRLVNEPDTESKCTYFERTLACMRCGQEDPAVYCCHQEDFKSIPGCPWVYWITPGLRRLFVELPMLGEIEQPRVGLQTGDNFRFLRYWWELGKSLVAFNCSSSEKAQASGKRWFPCMKGGSFRRWYGNQDYTINWEQDGRELKSLRPVSVIRNPSFYFQPGITWTYITSGKFNARLSPEGFIFDHAGNSLFPKEVNFLLGIMNSSLARYTLDLINPTINSEVGDLARLPIPSQSSDRLEDLVSRAISLAQADAAEDETTFDFIVPPWNASFDDTLTELQLRKDALKDVEQAIDEEVYQLYAISDEDRTAIESELAGPAAKWKEAEEENEQNCFDNEELALCWISYVVGIVMGRFQPGVSGALGQGRFASQVAERLIALADSDGVATLIEGHQDDLALKVWNALEIALGESGASEVVSTVLGDGNPEALLRRYLERDFWKRHLQQYHKRPVYWLLQSPAKSFSVYVFHERATRDTLPLILGTRYVNGKINQLKNRMDEVRADMKSAEGRGRKLLENDLEDLETKLLDLEAFEAAIRRVLEQKDERGETVGWAPEIDDGVLLNLAPLRELTPSWKEPEKFWHELAEGKYDWSYTAMRYWPDRVLEKCKTNKSYAIAHDRLDVYEGGK